MDIAVGLPVIRQGNDLWIGTTMHDITWQTLVSIAFLINNESKNYETEMVSLNIIEILDILMQNQFTLIHDGIDLIVNGKRLIGDNEMGKLSMIDKIGLNQIYGQIAKPSMTMPVMPTMEMWTKVGCLMNGQNR
ncbi:MAG: hypothetical protein WC284_15290 [Candidimonas sp.]